MPTQASLSMNLDNQGGKLLRKACATFLCYREQHHAQYTHSHLPGGRRHHTNQRDLVGRGAGENGVCLPRIHIQRHPSTYQFSVFRAGFSQNPIISLPLVPTSVPGWTPTHREIFAIPTGLRLAQSSLPCHIIEGKNLFGSLSGETIPRQVSK